MSAGDLYAMSTDFSDLVNAAEQLAADTDDGTSDWPKLNRTIRQLAEAAEAMWTRLEAKSGSQENQANVLLAPKGIDIPQMNQKLQSLSARKTFQALDPIDDTDVKSFLRNEYENGILGLIAQTQKQCSLMVNQNARRDMQRIWEREKIRIINGMNLSKKSFLESPMETEDITRIDLPSMKSMLSQQEMAYAKEIEDYNRAVMDGVGSLNLVDNFCKLSRTFNDKKAQDLWDMVRYMSALPTRPTGDTITSRQTPQVQNAIVTQAKKYLEDRYRTYMTTVVQANLQKAMRGGVPGTLPLVRSFVQVTVPASTLGLEDGLVENGLPVWPVIYYCLRCGDVGAAVQVARCADTALAEFSSVLENLQQSQSPSGLSLKMLQRVKAQYRRYTHTSSDPYKRAVYCAVGACDVLDEHREVAKTVDDYLWFKLVQIANEADDVEGEEGRWTLERVQTLVFEELGESHYKANEQPHIYSQMLLLTGQFEAAVDFLFRNAKYRVHGAHVAIALHEIGLLADPPNVLSALLSVDEGSKSPARRLNFVRLMRLYVSGFQVSDPKEAINYFYFLRDMYNDENENMFVLSVSDMTLESREFDLILGRLEHDGCRSPGLIDSFRGLKQSSNEIISRVAADCENKGNLEDAIKIYDLANNHEKVLSIMNTMLTQVVPHVSKPGSQRSRLVTLASNIANRYRSLDLSSSADTTSSFFLLKDLTGFFDQYHGGQFMQALETINGTKLLPQTKEEISDRVTSFRLLNDRVKRHIADVLLATMNILQSQFKKAKGNSEPPSSPKFDEKQHMLAYIRERARVLITFAGSLPYRMKGDTNSQLVQMETLMH